MCYQQTIIDFVDNIVQTLSQWLRSYMKNSMFNNWSNYNLVVVLWYIYEQTIERYVMSVLARVSEFTVIFGMLV